MRSINQNKAPVVGGGIDVLSKGDVHLRFQKLSQAPLGIIELSMERFVAGSANRDSVASTVVSSSHEVPATQNVVAFGFTLNREIAEPAHRRADIN